MPNEMKRKKKKTHIQTIDLHMLSAGTFRLEVGASSR